MKTNLLLLLIFIAVTIVALDSDNVERIGGTELNGNGCVCHTTEESSNVQVWVEGPDTLFAGQSALYKMFMFGGPAIAGGYNVAVRFGTLNLTDTLSLLIDNELTQAFPLPFGTTNDTVFWPFIYTAVDSVDIDTIYSVGISTNWDTIPDWRDEWAYGPKFPVRILHNILPIELLSFSGEISESSVRLNWVTASEKNNRGFEIERSQKSKDRSQTEWDLVGYVGGHGTSTLNHAYSFLDDDLIPGEYFYRLKQIDFDGSFTYSYEIEVDVNFAPSEFKLFQNYPNPFNPTTKIRFTIPDNATLRQAQSDNYVILKVYDAIGNEIATLANERKPAGEFEIEFNQEVSNLNVTSGIYFYRLEIDGFSQTKKMIFLK